MALDAATPRQEPWGEDALFSLRLALETAAVDARAAAKAQEERWALEGRLYELQVRKRRPVRL
jgi:hypothetical protein